MTKRRLPMVEHADTLSLKALRQLVTGLVTRADQADIRIENLEAENQKLRDESDQLRIENTRLKIDNQLLRDEIARLKNLPPRPPFKPSGMEKATSDKAAGSKEQPSRRRGPKGDTGRVTREEVLFASVPPGSRFKGYKDCVEYPANRQESLKKCRNVGKKSTCHPRFVLFANGPFHGGRSGQRIGRA